MFKDFYSTWLAYSSWVHLVSDDDSIVQTWRPQPFKLGKYKRSHQLNDIGYIIYISRDSCQKRNPLASVTYCRLRCSLWTSNQRQSHKMTLRGNIQVNLGQLMHVAYIFAVWYGRSISWSIDSCENKVSADQYHMTYHGLKCRTHRGHVFFKVDHWLGYRFSLDRRLKYFHKSLGQAKNLELRLKAWLKSFIST